MKKLMLTTALATSLLVSVATAEVSIKGALEVTLGSGELLLLELKLTKVLQLVTKIASHLAVLKN